MDSEEPDIRGILWQKKTVVEDLDMINALEARGYGQQEGKKFTLSDFESLYLVHAGRLVLRQKRTALNFDDLVHIYKRSDPDILTKFLIYRDLRTRGYVVKAGFGFGSDFRVYEKGDFGHKGARYLIFAFSEGTREKIGLLQKKVSEITRMGKEPIVAVVERRGEIIFYKISNTNFLENRRSLSD